MGGASKVGLVVPKCDRYTRKGHKTRGGALIRFFLDYVSSHLINDAPGNYKHFRKKIMIIS